MRSIFVLETGALIRNVESIAGEDMTGKGSVNCPAAWETMRWDQTTRTWVADAVSARAVRERNVDNAYVATYGAAAIREARLRLVIEAAIFAVNGNAAMCRMLSAEAAMRGITTAQLAGVIRIEDDAWIAREIARKAAKI